MRQATQAEQGANGWIFARSHYRYDELSRLRGAWRDEQSGKGEGYSYDQIGQLTDVVYNADNVSTGNPGNWASWSRKVIYNVDPLNRISVNENGTLTSYTPDPMNQYTGISGQGLAYDGNFNLSYLNGGSVYYAAEKRVTSITIGGATVAQFVYDGLGRCLKRTLDGVPTLIAYHGWKPFIEWDNAGNMIAYNIYGAGPDEILTRWQTGVGHLHYHLDRMGNVQFLLSEGNAGLEKYTYDAFGDPTITNWDGSGGRNFSNYGNRFMFTGREYFPSLALYDYRNRFYRPNLGRFLQSDPIGFAGGDTNLFRYCGGDPVNRRDPSGTDATIGDDGDFYATINFTNGGDRGQRLMDYAMNRLNTAFAPLGRWVILTPGNQNQFSFWNPRDHKDALGGGVQGNFFGGATTGFMVDAPYAGLSAEDLFVHEVLHFLGHRDKYRTLSNGTREPHEGWKDNIMGGVGGKVIDGRNLAEIIHANGTGVGGSLGIFTVNYSGNSVSGGIQAVIDEMNAIAARTNTQGPGIISVNGRVAGAVWVGGTFFIGTPFGALMGGAAGAGSYSAHGFTGGAYSAALNSGGHIAAMARNVLRKR